MWTSALLRRVHAAGGFAMVLYRGDDSAGSVIIIHRTWSQPVRALSRVATLAAPEQWRVAAVGESVDGWIDRQRRYDPDLWVIELDVADLAPFIDETAT